MAPRPEHPEGPASPAEIRRDAEHGPDLPKPVAAIGRMAVRAEDDVRPPATSEDLQHQRRAALSRSVSSRTARARRARVPAPDGGWGWMVLLGVVISNILVIGHAKTFGVYLDTFIERFDETPSAVAWIQSIQFSFFLGFAPVASMLAERFSPRAVALCGALLACAGMGLSSEARSLTQLYCSYGILMGLASVCTFTPGVMMISRYFDRRRGLANGLGMAGNSLGGIFMPIIADFLLSEWSTRGGLLIMAGILLNAAVGAMFWRPLEPARSVRPLTAVPRSRAPPSRHTSAERTHTAAANARQPLPSPMRAPPPPAPPPAPPTTTMTPATDCSTTPLLPDDDAQRHDHQQATDLTAVMPMLEGGGGDGGELSSTMTTSKTADADGPDQAVAVRDELRAEGPSCGYDHADHPPQERSATPDTTACDQPHTSAPPPAASSPSRPVAVSVSTSVPDVANLPPTAFEVQSQPSTSPPPPLSAGGGSADNRRRVALDHQSVCSHSTASLSSFVYLSTFHLGPSFGTVEDITNLEYDDADRELESLAGDDDGNGARYNDDNDDADQDADEDDDDYDVYETVRARSDLRIDLAGLLVAGGGSGGAPPRIAAAAAAPAVETPPVAGAVHPEHHKASAATAEPPTTPPAPTATDTAVAFTVSAASGAVEPTVQHLEPTPLVTASDQPGDRRGGGSQRRVRPRPASRGTANKYLDFSFFRSSVFYVMMVPLFLHYIGYPTIQMYTPMYAHSLGFSSSDSARSLSSLALADVIGRIGCAWLSDLHLCKRKYFYIAGMCLSGLIAYCLPMAKTYVQLLLCTAGFGFASGAYIGLTVALFADAFGNEKVAKAHSMATMCTGLAGLAGGPFIGYVLERTNSFLLCYVILGSCQILGGLIYLLEPWATRREAQKDRKRHHNWV